MTGSASASGNSAASLWSGSAASKALPSPVQLAGNIGTDLMIKVLRVSETLEMGAMVGIDPDSDGLARAARLGVADHRRRRRRPDRDAELRRHRRSSSTRPRPAPTAPTTTVLRSRTASSMRRPDPGRDRPYVVPAVNLDEHLDAPNVNMVTCGGQATIPIVAAVVAWSPVCPTPRSSLDRVASRPGPAPAPTSTSSPRPPRAAIEAVGGARARQGDHRPQPGRAAADHARHRVLPGRRPARPRRDRGVRRDDGRRRARRTCPATASSRRCSSTTIGRDDPLHIPEGVGDVPAASRSRCSSRSRAPAHYLPATPATSTS